MDLFSPLKRWSSLPLIAALAAAACGKAEVTTLPGSGSGPGGPGTSGPGGAAVPAFNLPDASPAAPPPATPPPPDRQCAEEAHRAEVVPLDLLLLVDASGSMDGLAGNRTKWATAQSALGAFIRDPRSAGLGMGLQFFPANAAKACTTDADCFPGATGTGAFCVPRSVCAGANAPSPPLGCGGNNPIIVIGGGAPRCPSGTSCVTAGTCATSGADCTNIGQPCPAGGGTCMAGGRVCRGFSFGADECAPAMHEKPAVAIGTLPMAQLPLVRELNAATPGGGTPMGPAVRGALAHLQAHLQTNPGRKAALVLASDGLPSGLCGMNDIPGIAAELGAAFTGTPSIPTYVIGVFAMTEIMSSQMQLDQLAMAGGSDRAFVLAANADLTMRLQEALDQIRGAALACEYQIPPPMGGRIDFAKVNVRFTAGAAPENIPYVERADRCDPTRGGWYYDTPPTTGAPTRILVCEATCRRFKAEPSGKVDLVFGCGTQIIN